MYFCNGIWAVLQIPQSPQSLTIKYDSAMVTWPWPWVAGEDNELMGPFFLDWE